MAEKGRQSQPTPVDLATECAVKLLCISKVWKQSSFGKSAECRAPEKRVSCFTIPIVSSKFRSAVSPVRFIGDASFEITSKPHSS